MIGASQHGGRARPVLESALGRIGIAVVLLFSATVGCGYWWTRDWQFSILTAGAELVALVGLSITLWQFGRGAWGRGICGIVVTALAAGWCGLTMFQKIDADSRVSALAAARERPAYVFASNAAQTAETLLTARLRHPNPRPECSCPQTIAAWEAAEASAIDRLRTERDAAVAQMEAAIPPHKTDWIAIGRGVAIEVAKLLGFIAFGLVVIRSPRRNQVVEPVERQPPRQPFEVVEGGRSTAPTTVAQPVQPSRRPLFGGRWLSLKNMGKATVGAGVAAAAQPALPPPQPPPTTPLNHPAETVVESTAAPIRWDELPEVARTLAATMGERRVAAKMTERYGEYITRHQVRIWLGRDRHAA